MPELLHVLTLCAALFASISPITCLYMFYRYYWLPRKNFGAKMIITLSIADFIFHSIFIINLFVPRGLPEELGDNLMRTAFSFSIFWSFCIAFLIYKLISRNKRGLRPSKYYRRSCLIILGLSLGLSALEFYGYAFYRAGDFFKGSLVSGISVASYLISLGLTTAYYAKSIRILKQDSHLTSQAAQQFINTLYRYAFVQLITAGPSLLYKEFSLITETSTEEITEEFFLIFLTSMGFTNSMVYFFTRDGFGASAESSIKDGDSSDSDDESFDDYQRQLVTQVYS